ncbi:hypothetical protein J7E50_02680 [Pedobacter sp. ISL-68]|uniref:hypothetical protein n=1 Tax=unclassified Pedobacter TaxID=2628915 RepID=UPI001BE7CB56|nr:MULTISPECIES: hypothetical protein [unclassified Pedobacter]MBT2560125.1 hypothetical protein [Pedobacter sp. ISL-64]MBT2589104.1 hypothetical protein [Pedobacter sp. ISL-68]
MRLFWTIFALSLLAAPALAQRIVFDPRHFQAVLENGSVSSTAELTHNQYLGKIDGNLQTINTNVGSVVLVQTMIYQSLSNVNSALKNGLVVKDMAVIVNDILRYADQTIALARAEPYLLLFAESHAAEIRGRATRLVMDVSGFILKEGDNMLADYNSRDQLLNHVRRELQIIDGMAYGAWKAMFWAKQKGIIASLNPFASFINKDRTTVEDIIRNAKYLKQ